MPTARELVAQSLPPVVRSDEADDLDAAAERRHVVRDVGGAAQPVSLVIELHDRHRRFGGDAFDAADHEMIEHHVADDEDRAPRERQQRAQLDRQGGHGRRARVGARRRRRAA